MSEAIYVINLSKVYWTRRYRRAARAIKAIREFIMRHTRAKDVIIDSSVSEYVFSRAYDRPPRKVTVRVIKVDEGVFKASLAIRIK